MKKFTLFAIATLFSAVSFAALNPFAYALSSTLSADETTLTVNYSLNAEATSVKIVVLDGETVLKTVDCSTLGLAKGAYTTTIPTADLPKTKSLTWKVEVTGAAVTAPTAVSGYRLFHPAGVDIDNDIESPYFGRILATEAMQSVASKTDTYLTAGFGAGIVEFNAAFEHLPNGTRVGYTGGKTFSTASNMFAPRRVRISADGRIFATAQDNSGEYLWEINPNNLDEWTAVFKGTNSSNKLSDADGNFIAGTNSGFDVKGSDENLQLIMLSGALPGAQVTTFQLHEYNLGSATSWSSTPSKTLTGCQLNANMITNQSQVQYDNEGGYWITYWVNATVFGGIAHFTKDGVKDYSIDKINMRNAGFRFNKDFSKVIIATNDLTGASKTYKQATVYAVSKDSEGKPVLTKEVTIDMTTVGNNLNDFAWDHANNIYVVGNSSEWIYAYALPHAADEVVATPAAAKYAFQLQEAVGAVYNVTATVNNETMGSVAGAGEYAEGATVTLTATANEGYKFVNWTVGEETSTENPLTLTVAGNIAVTANFEALAAYTVAATANNEALGTVAGAGTYYDGATITLRATANTGAQFVNWTVGEETLTENPLTLTANKDYTVVANFEALKYTVAALTNDAAKGTVEGAGTYTYGEEVVLKAVPAEGYKLLYWSDRVADAERTITVAGNTTLSAYFVKEYTSVSYTVEKVWENTNVPSATGNGYQAVGWDGKIYMQDAGNKKIVTYASAEDAGTDYATEGGAGQQIAVDEVGNLVVFNATFYSATPNAILIYKKGSTEGKAVSFTLPQPGRCDFFTASGDIYSAEGGYVYFYCQNKTVVNRLKIANSAAAETDVTVDVVGNDITAGGSQNHVMVDIFGNLAAHCRSNAVSWINVHTNESSKTFANTLAGIKLSTLGGCTFELGGKELWAYNVGSTAYNSEWNLYNLTDKEFLSETALYAKNTTDKNSAANWLNVQVVDEKTAYIYQFCPKVAAAVWKVTCTAQEPNVTPTAIEDIQSAPQVEKIIRNGQVLIIRDGKTYNMMGQEIR